MKFPNWLPVFLTSLLPFGCVAAEPPGNAWPAGSPMVEPIYFQYAVYYLPQPAKDPREVLRHQVASIGKNLKAVDQLPKVPSEAYVRATLEKDVQKNYRPTDMNSLQYFGRGLSKEQAQALQTSAQALILDFVHPKKRVWEALANANKLVEQIARKTGGLIWDEETREVFTPDEWRTRRVASLGSGVPDVTKQIVIHAYRDKDLVRAITLGMGKFGLPDVVMNNFSWSLNRQIGHVINLFCQTMAEGASVHKAGEFDLDLKAVRHPNVREPQVQTLKVNATAVAKLSLTKGIRENGDPNNRIVELGADRYPGPDIHAKQDKMVSSLFGWEDSIVKVKHTAALKEASERARSKLPTLKAAFSAGLRPGEFIQVKTPFSTPAGGTEWMWVEVTKWNGNAIEGLLKNEPFNIPTLHGGQIVTVKENEVFDYIRRFPDGKQEGNETGMIIEEMQKQQKK